MSLIYVDSKKEKHADEIVELLGRTAKHTEEEKLQKKFKAFVKDENPKDVKKFIYEKLGGLVREDIEHEEEGVKRVYTKRK